MVAIRQRLVQDAGLAVLFASLAYVVLFWHLGAASFWDPDEAHYAETSQEMVATSDWWAPHYNEQPFFDKPALFHQLQAIAMVAFGPTEFAARIVPALAALGLVLVTAWFGSVTRARDTGIVAGLQLVANRCLRAGTLRHPGHAVHAVSAWRRRARPVAALCDRRQLQWAGLRGHCGGGHVAGPALVLCGLAFGPAIVSSAELRQRLLVSDGWLASRWWCCCHRPGSSTCPAIWRRVRAGECVLDENLPVCIQPLREPAGFLLLLGFLRPVSCHGPAWFSSLRRHPCGC